MSDTSALLGSGPGEPLHRGSRDGEPSGRVGFSLAGQAPFKSGPVGIGAVEESPAPALLLCRQRSGAGSRLGIQHPAPTKGNAAPANSRGNSGGALAGFGGELSKWRPYA